MADLGVKNEKLFTNVGKVLLRKERRNNPDIQEQYKPFLEPIDCAMFMTAFCRTEVFDNEVLYLL